MNRTLLKIVGTSLVILGVLAALEAPVAANADTDRPLEPIDVARGAATSASYVLELDAGRLDLRGRPGGDGRALVGVLDLRNAQSVERTVEAGAHLVVALRGSNPPRPRIIRGGHHWDLDLAADLPATLTVRSGVGDTMLDLRGTEVHGVELDAGIGDHEVYLPEGDTVARLTAGLGELTVYVPRDAIVRIDLDGRRALDSVPEGFFAVPGGYARDGSGAVLELTLDIGFGKVQVRSY